MKKDILFVLLTVLLSSCFELDNYDAPNAYPHMVTRPSSGRSSVASILITVVFPAPLIPRNPSRLPRAT